MPAAFCSVATSWLRSLEIVCRSADDFGTSASVRSVPKQHVGFGDDLAHAGRHGLEAIVADADDVDAWRARSEGSGGRRSEVGDFNPDASERQYIKLSWKCSAQPAANSVWPTNRVSLIGRATTPAIPDILTSDLRPYSAT